MQIRNMKQGEDKCNTVLCCHKINNTQSEHASSNTTMASSVTKYYQVLHQRRVSALSNDARLSQISHQNQKKIMCNQNQINRPHFSSWKMFYLIFILISNWTIVYSASTEPSGIRIDPDDGGYTGIVFEIKEEVPEESCAEIIKNLKIMLSGASRTLSTALDGKAYYKQVTVVVPTSWRDIRCNQEIHTPRSGSSYGAPDVYVSDQHSIHRQTPFTQQSRGCGQRGDYISMPFQFLTNWNDTWKAFGDPSKIFVNEWSKLRYGVFDQHGYPNDPVYPNYFLMENDRLVPTGTSNVELKGSWKDVNGTDCNPAAMENTRTKRVYEGPENFCHFVPSMNKNQEVTCSLGYVPFLPNVDKYCTDEEDWVLKRGAFAPTKHNGLCSGKSAMDVILSHRDFNQNRQSNIGNSRRLVSTAINSRPILPLNPVSVRVVRRPRPKYVLVIESSSSMNRHGLWKWISKAAQKFIRYDLPSSSQIAVVTFSNVSVVRHSLAELGEERNGIADTIPDKYKVQRSSNKRCVYCGIKVAMDEVLLSNGDQAAGAHIILVTRGANDSLSLQDQNAILNYAYDNKVRFSSILLPENNPANNFYDKLSKVSNGRTIVVPSNIMNNRIGAETYFHIIEAFQNLRRLDTRFPYEIPVTVYSKVATRAEGLVTKGNFTVDSTLGRETLFGIIVNDIEDHFIKSVTFKDSDGVVYGPFSTLTNNYNVINIKTINFPKNTRTKIPPFDDLAHLDMPWYYELNWWQDDVTRSSDKNMENIVFVESKPRDLGTFGLVNVNAWINSDETDDTVTFDQPLSIFASVTRGNSPVLNAKVTMVVKVGMRNGTVETYGPIPLLDNGNGDPDLTSNDGIYSRHITYYPGPGRYTFIITADNNKDRAYSIQIGRGGRSMPTKPPNPNFPVCCGSDIHVPRDLRSTPRTGSFKRKAATTPTIHLFSVPDGTSVDKMPPSRIGDLQIQIDSSVSEINADWTSPGGNYDSGSVSGYNIVYSDSYNALRLAVNNNKPSQISVLHRLQRRDVAGEKVSHSFTFKDYDKNYFVAMYAYDQRGNQGKLSNIVRVRMSSPNGQGTSPGPTDPTTTTNWLTVGIIAASVVGVLFILLIALYIYFFCVRRKQNQHDKNLTKSKSSGVNVDIQHGATPPTAGSDHTDASSYDDAKNSSSNQLVPNISTITETYNQHNIISKQGPRSFGNGITPTYWSASQLLKEHEERKRREAEEQAAEASMKLVSGQRLAEETNMGYDYGGEQIFQQYGYYGNGMVAQPANEALDNTYPAQYDLYHGQYSSQIGYPYEGQQLNNSLDHMTGYPINYPPVIPYQMNADYINGIQPALQIGSNQIESFHQGNDGGIPEGASAEEIHNLQGLNNIYSTDATSANTGASTNSPNQVHNNPATDAEVSTTAVPKQSNASDNSSSGTLGVVNPSLQGSLLSVDGRPPSTLSKTRNITQV